MLKKSILLVITLLVIGLAVVSAQTSAVPLPPTPAFKSTLKRPPARKTLNQAQLQRIFTIRDQLKYAEAMRNEGRMTWEEFNKREESARMEEYNIFITAGIDFDKEEDGIESIFINNDIDEAIKMLWPNDPAGWPSDQVMREILRFTLRQPAGTRATRWLEYGFRINITPMSEQNYNNLKQQLEAGLGVTMTYDAEFNNHTYVLRSNKSGNGRPYSITLYRTEDKIVVSVGELRKDP
jgi:hypothetical protein